MTSTQILATPVSILETSKRRHDGWERPLLRVVVVGSVDDGKSTLLGRLLFECDGLADDQIASVRKRGGGASGDLAAIDYSLFVDGLLAEREQGITIDVAWRSLQTQHLRLLLADTPGHVQYTRNMATGASLADAVVILIDARLGVLEQTRRHAFIASLLGIRHVSVAVNKIDLVDDPEKTFGAIRDEITPFWSQLGFVGVQVIPTSAVRGDNVTVRADIAGYDGPSILGWLESLPQHRASESKGLPLRLPVQTILRPDLHYRGAAGAITAGEVAVGDEVLVLPSGRRSRVKSIDTFDGPLGRAHAPLSVSVQLEDNIDVARGDIIVGVDNAPTVTRRFEAELVWFSEVPLKTSHRLFVKHGSKTVAAVVTEVLGRRDLVGLGEVQASTLSQNDLGRVRIELMHPLAVDRYGALRDTGAFIIIDPQSNDTVAAGMVTDASLDAVRAVADEAAAQKRQVLLGQRGAVVVVAVSDAVGSTVSALLDRGVVAAAAASVDDARAIATAAVVAVVVASADIDGALVIDGTLGVDIDGVINVVRADVSAGVRP